MILLKVILNKQTQHLLKLHDVQETKNVGGLIFHLMPYLGSVSRNGRTPYGEMKTQSKEGSGKENLDGSLRWEGKMEENI